MKISKKATSIVEAMIVILIVSMWVVWMYKIFFNATNLIDSTANKIQAISIAREWIEAMTNIRDTNWLILWADFKNCWNVLNYKSGCIWAASPATSTDIPVWSYTIYKDIDNNWKLNKLTSWNYSNNTYRINYRVWITWSWFFTQTWITNNLKPVFTREIKIEYSENTSTDINWNIIPNWIDSNDEKMKVTSLVQWKDRHWTNIHEVKFETILSNWKNK